MALSSQSRKPKQKIFDELRGIWVAATEEEIVRQTLLHQMVGLLGYPKELLAIEREIGLLPHLQGVKVPDRRVDILCFGRGIHPDHALYPLLLIECKKEGLGFDAKEQLLGYNSYVGAYFISMAAKDELLFGYPDRKSGTYAFASSLPPYQELINAIKNGRV
ncbi:MAG: type I restriction enzyme HsdR N-terminal domain-containing protein [Chlamydiales bacterium]|nr:type I restriction enzyme HsdR N-terminal domain-containing protein [Chlamydiales bacterium]